jgi:NAD(P)-dependent dehydrogenase (short-subunit alcohol dehydrogenase family)
MDPSGVTALVTGAGHRIGRAISLALAESGARVAVHYNTSADAAAETVAMVQAIGAQAEAFQADLGDAEQASALVGRVAASLGTVRILVNNASLFGRQSLEDTGAEEWDGYFAVNARAPFLLAKAMAAQLPEGETGKIINLGDWRTARKNRFAYGASKAALSGLTRSLAYALAPGVQVNEVALGAILPPADVRADRPGESQDRGEIPARRTGTLNEVTQAVLALIHNDYITGERIRVDGGRHIA